jgi:hypothetical protein
MRFIKKLFVNFALLALILAVLYAISPEIMGGVYKLYYALFGPILLLLLVLNAALPRRRR